MANKELRYLRSAFNFGVKEEFIQTNPTDKLAFFSIEKRVKSVSVPEDILKLAHRHRRRFQPRRGESSRPGQSSQWGVEITMISLRFGLPSGNGLWDNPPERGKEGIGKLGEYREDVERARFGCGSSAAREGRWGPAACEDQYGVP